MRTIIDSATFVASSRSCELLRSSQLIKLMLSVFWLLQMPRGIPVGTLAINNAMNAALQVVRVFGAIDPAMSERIVAYHKDLERIVLEKAGKLEAVGWEKYLEGQRKQ
jgi:phosphoribosylcarboxyaminoimidazole (NCAIR) mutase